MELEYKGATAVIIKAANSGSIVLDPKIEQFGLKNLKVTDAIELATHPSKESDSDDQKILINGPGEYEVSNISIKGIAAAHFNQPEDKVTIYSITISGVRVVVLGHIQPNLDEAQLETIGLADVLVLPVGGNNITLSPHDAAKIVNQIDPKIVVPVHYQDKAIKYDVEQETVDVFLKELAATEHQVVDKLKLKNAVLPAVRTVIQVTRT